MDLDALVKRVVTQQQAEGHLAPSPSDAPVPGSFHMIKRGDTLLGLAGRVYQLPPGEARLAAARRINDALYNRRFRDTALTDNGLFPRGRVSFNPRFACDLTRQSKEPRHVSSGECFARIWIPRSAKTVFTGPPHAPAAPLTVGRRLLDQMHVSGGWCGEPKQPGPIVGDDDRQPVTNTLRAPFRWICKLWSVFGSSGQAAVGQATGFIVDPDTIITAGHVIDDPNEGVADHVLVLPGLNRHSPLNTSPLSSQDAPFGAFVIEKRGRSISNFLVSPEWRADRSSRHDYGLIRFRKDQQVLSGKTIEDGWNTVSKSLADVGVANIERQKHGRADPREIARLLRLHSGRISVAGYGFDRPCRQLAAHGGHARRLLFPDTADHNLMELFP